MLRSIATVGGWTMASRVLGFVRDILIARLLGAGVEADAFFVAFRLPNLFRRLFAEGAFNAAFIPLYTRALAERGGFAAHRFAEETLALLVTALLGVALFAELTMPWLMALIAPGFTAEPVKYTLAVQFTRITFPYLVFIALAALYASALNAHRRFAHAAAVPVLLNVVMIAAMLLVAPRSERTGLVLAWSVTLAGIAQFLWLVPPAAASNATLRLPVRPVLTPELKRLLKLMVPGVIGSGAMQINLMIGTMIASLAPGAVSYLYYADRIYQLPLGVIGSAIGVVLLPEISRSLRSGETAAANDNLKPRHRASASVDAARRSGAHPHSHGDRRRAVRARRIRDRGDTSDRCGPRRLRIRAAGLCADQGVDAGVLRPRRHAHARSSSRSCAMIANIVLAFALIAVLAHVGIALRTSLSAWLNPACSRAAWPARFSATRCTASAAPAANSRASFAMAALLWLLLPWLDPLPPTLGLSLLIGAGAVGLPLVARVCDALDFAAFALLARRRS